MIDLDSKKPILFNGNEMTERDFAREMNVSGTPTTIFFDSSGKELGRQVGFIGIEELQRLLAYVNSDRFHEVPFEEFEGGR
ncbi:thioredoxin family protein [Rhodohalobacter sp. 8-1]|uniref:thioredoxin family protein n=1 Tax=Rhodohalobacter sp. 8-1 TaxID=3131972 RepID=UPI0030EBD105